MTDKITVGSLVLEIHQDEFPPNPRTEQDNLGKMVLYQKRYDLPNELRIDIEGSRSWQDLYERLDKEFDCRVILPVYMMDHSGLTFRCGHGFGDVDPQQWDWGQVGFIAAIRKDILENFTGYDGNKREPMKQRISKKMLETTTRILRGEVELYNKYANGECYFYRLYDMKRAIAAGGLDATPQDFIETVGGFYSIEDIATSVPKQFRKRLEQHDFDRE